MNSNVVAELLVNIAITSVNKTPIFNFFTVKQFMTYKGKTVSICHLTLFEIVGSKRNRRILLIFTRCC